MTKPLIANIYNPDKATHHELIDRFVVRIPLFEQLFKSIQTAELDRPAQHYLLQGRRGMGKTTLLLRLAYAIEDDISASKYLLPVVFNEEEYSINKLSRLWERCAEILEDKHSEYIGLPKRMEDLYPSFSNDEEQFELAVFTLLKQELQKQGKRIVLFIDNFGDIFKRFDDLQVHRLRSILMEDSSFHLVAASPTILGELQDVKHPLYELFHVKQLKPLNQKDTFTLLHKLAELEQNENVKYILKEEPGKVETLRRLTGGVIRTIVLLFEVFAEDKTGNAFKDLNTIIDRATPLYKHRMDDLSTQQKQIVEAIALAWDAISVKEIAQRTRLESKVISAQLNQLTQNEIVARIPTNIKNHLYEIDERFFNIWYLMRFGRRDSRVLWLTRFLEIWCDTDSLVKRADLHIQALQSKTYDGTGAYLMHEALSQSKNLPRAYKDKLSKETKEYLSEREPQYVNELSPTDQTFAEEAQILFNEGKYHQAIEKLLFITKPNDSELYMLGVIYYIIGDISSSETYYLKAIEAGNTDAFNNLGILYADNLNDHEKAESYFIKATEAGSIDASNSLAWLYFQSAKNKEKALKAVSVLPVADLFNAHTSTCVYLWNNEFEKAWKTAEVFLSTQESIEAYENDLNTFFVLALAKEQFDPLYTFFTDEKGLGGSYKDRFKPIWYALMHYMRNEHPLEYLRMGAELKETVEEIIAEAEKFKILYA